MTTPAAASAASVDADWVLRKGVDIVRREASAVETAADRLGESFVQAVRLVVSCTGRVAVTGLGKAGDVGRKIQTTLSSTGSPAYMFHPVEALHGDLGMVRPEDVLLALSKSGETQELAAVLPAIRSIGCSIILLTARVNSRCARAADVVIDIGDAPEACPIGMAPSSSTAAMLAIGDAIALTVMELKNIRPEQYAKLHPGGALGRSLMRVTDIMRTGADCPVVDIDGTLMDFDRSVRSAPRRAGAAAVVDKNGRLLGIFTHGDLFRLLHDPEHPAKRRLRDVMTAAPKSVNHGRSVGDALRIMQSARIDELPVVDDDGRVVGMMDVQDLLAEGFSVFDDG